MKRLIEYFSEKHILTNLFVVATLIGAVYFWNSTRKEELPNIDYDVVRVSASLSVELDPKSPARGHVVSDISDAVAAVDYPQTMDLPRVSGVSEVGYNAYLNKFVEINVRPERPVHYDVTLQEITQALRKSIINQPIGALFDQALTKIKLESEVTDPEQLDNIIIRSNFEGNMIRQRRGRNYPGNG